MAQVEEPLLILEHVHKHYDLPGRQVLRAVNDVNFALGVGECLAVVGESGCGKSTLARIAAGVEPVSEGSVFFEGEPVQRLRGQALRTLRRKIQILFQDPISVFSPRMKIGEFLCEPFINYGLLPKRNVREKALSLLEIVGLPGDYFNRYPHQLSGGELQRVAITRAMALQPSLLICDEPTSALDVTIQKRILDLLDELRLNSGAAMLFISHDLAVVSRFAQRIMVMYLGYVMEILPGTLLWENARHPYTKALLQAVFPITKHKSKVIKALDGEAPSTINLPAGCPFRQRCSAAGELCDSEVPRLRESAPGHSVACHYTLL